jgi:hypothetical protein
LLVDLLQLPTDEFPRVAFAGQHLPDLCQAQPESPVCEDPMQPAYVRFGVQAVSRTAPPRRLQQPDRVVVVQRPHAESGGLRELADPPAPAVDVHASTLRPDIA